MPDILYIEVLLIIMTITVFLLILTSIFLYYYANYKEFAKECFQIAAISIAIIALTFLATDARLKKMPYTWGDYGLYLMRVFTVGMLIGKGYQLFKKYKK